MLTLAERLNHALSVRGKSQAEFARALGIARASVTELVKGESKSMKAANLLKASSFLNVNANWLASGRGVSGLETPVFESATPIEVPVAAERLPEPPPVAWPFNTITREQVDALSPAGLAMLEQHMQVAFGVIALTPANFKPDAGSRKALAAA